MSSAGSRSDIQKDVHRGMAWIGVASALVGIADIAANVILLAIWLTPYEYGVAALAITLFPILDRAAELGLSAAVIQRDDHTPEKIATVFWLNVIVSAFMCAALGLIVGPALARLHGHAVVGTMLTAYGARLLFNNVYLIPDALMRRELRFKELSLIRILANVAEFAGKLGFAAAGFGVWCLVLGPFCRVLVTGVGVQLRHPWRPRLHFRPRETRAWATFSIKASASDVLFHVYTNVDYQVVGYTFGAVANGFYKLASEIVLAPVKMITEAFNTAAFPAYARVKRHKDKLAELLISFTRMNLVIMLGILGAVFTTAEDLIAVFWGPEWVAAAPAIRILCVVGVLRSQSYLMPHLLNAVGRPDLSLRYTSMSAVLLPLMFIASAQLLGDVAGFLSVAIAWAIGYPIPFLLLCYLVLAIIELRPADYLRQLYRLPATAAFAIFVALATHWALSTAPTSARLAATLIAMFGTYFVLLARFEGITLRSVIRTIRG